MSEKLNRTFRLQKAQAAAEAEANRKAALQAGKEAALKNKAKVRALRCVRAFCTAFCVKPALLNLIEVCRFAISTVRSALHDLAVRSSQPLKVVNSEYIGAQ